MKSLRKGFTLVELMVVIVIIGILAALAIPRFLGATNKAKATEFKPVLKQISTLEQAYNQEKGVFSNSLAQIGFDLPSGSSRFTYSTTATAAGAAGTNGTLGEAAVSATGLLKAPGGTDLNGYKACVDTLTAFYATDSLASVANVTSKASGYCP